jgi:hypothetical protein
MYGSEVIICAVVQAEAPEEGHSVCMVYGLHLLDFLIPSELWLAGATPK